MGPSSTSKVQSDTRPAMQRCPAWGDTCSHIHRTCNALRKPSEASLSQSNSRWGPSVETSLAWGTRWGRPLLGGLRRSRHLQDGITSTIKKEKKNRGTKITAGRSDSVLCTRKPQHSDTRQLRCYKVLHRVSVTKEHCKLQRSSVTLPDQDK
jgi:hypothetical protein